MAYQVIPIRFRTQIITKQHKTVVETENTKLNQNDNPYFINARKDKNNTSEGSTNQKICRDNSAICITSPPSIFSQTKASKDVNGNEANIAAIAELRLAISVTATITSAETVNLVR